MSKTFKHITFREALPRLLASYNRGKLVPFTGAGISAPSIPAWKKMVENLCHNNKYPAHLGAGTTAKQLIEVSEEIVTALLRESKFTQAVRESLGYKTNQTPKLTPQCEQLSRIWWPLVMTTNYDTMFVNSYTEKQSGRDGPPISIYGRSEVDCHSLLSSLSAPSNTAYWALQGYFGKSQNKKDLEKEIVVGYRQYRRATYNNATFRAAFGEIYRNNSFLFVGSGLTEDYFMGLFGEVLEKFGSNPYNHCALFNVKDLKNIDHHFLHKKLNIVSIFYEDIHEDYDGLPQALHKLELAIKGESNKLWQLSFSNKQFSKLEHQDVPSGLDLSVSVMPPPKKLECVVFSAGKKENGVLLSGHGKDYVKKYYGKKYNDALFVQSAKSRCWQYNNTDLYAAVARNNIGLSSHDSRDLREVSNAVYDTLTVLHKKYQVINIMLLAAGEGRVFPPIYSLVAMIKGYKQFVARQKELKCIVRVHIVDPSVVYYIRQNPLKIEEMLNCDEMLLNVEIHEEHEIERFQIYLNDQQKMRHISRYYSIKKKYWNVHIVPTAFQNQQIDTDAAETIESLGLIPGSTIIYTRKQLT